MADYISRETAIYKKAFEVAVRCARELNGTPELKEAYVEAQKNNMALLKFTDFCLEKATEELSEQPSADAAPVVHGRWLTNKSGAACCSACKREMNPNLFGYAYCPQCGAKMDGGD